MHCRTWTEWRRIKDPAKVNTWIKNEVVTGKPTHLTEKVTLHCTTNMVAYRNNRCPHCRMKIPEEVQGLWKMQNWDRIQELSNG